MNIFNNNKRVFFLLLFIYLSKSYSYNYSYITFDLRKYTNESINYDEPSDLIINDLYSLYYTDIIFGSQERGLFGGTENVIGIASLGKAIEKYSYKDINTDIRDFVFNVITEKIPDVCLVGSHTNRLPYNLYLAFKGVDSQQLVALLNIQNIQVSTGSACNNGDATPSQTLVAIGLDNELINSCIRLTFSGKESKGELIYLCNIIRDCVKFLRN